MADRFLYAEWMSSERLHNVSERAQNVWLRLLMVADSFGCFDGRHAVIANVCWPLGAPFTIQALAEAMGELQKQKLLVRYLNTGKSFIALTQWRVNMRLYRKFPAPPVDVDSPGLKFSPVYGRKINWMNPPGFDNVSKLIDIDGEIAAPQPKEWRRQDGTPINRKRDECLSDHAAFLARKAALREAEEDIDPGTAVEGLHSSPSDVRPTEQELHSSPSEMIDSQALHSRPSIAGLPTGNINKDRDVGVDVNRNKNEVVVVVADDSSARTREKNPGDDNGGDLVEKRTAKPPSQSLPTSGTNGGITWANGDWHGVSQEQRLKWQDMFNEVSIPDQLARSAAWLQANPAERGAIQAAHEEEAFIVRWLLRETRGKRTDSARGAIDA